jgi:polysaccharide biosynthesis transport protein
VLLVTSGLPGEGKTSLATGLGLVAARGGRRTIVVDLDIRRPSVEMALGMSRSGGLTACVLDGQPVRQAVREVPLEPGLHVLGNAGTRTGETPVVRSPALRRLVAELRQTYDLVIIDSPPLLGLADTKQLAGLADRVLFAVRWGRTPAAAARAALQWLCSAPALVAVLQNRDPSPAGERSPGCLAEPAGRPPC